jgi:N-acetylmuramoyl-L-alanine amidase
MFDEYSLNAICDDVEIKIVQRTEVVEYPKQCSVEILSGKLINEKDSEDDLYFSEDDIELIALLTMAEAEGECEVGKRLVIDTVLNRIVSEQFPDTVHDVVYQTNQFSSLYNGRIERCYVDDYICELVRSEIESQLNLDVIFFTAGKYSKYGTPMFQVGNHYFSSD